MKIEIKVPALPESVVNATVAKWYKKAGDMIARDENLVDLETDKVMLEVPATQNSIIEKILVPEGSVVTAGQVLAILNTDNISAKDAKEEVATPAQPSDKAEALSPAVRRRVAEQGIDLNQITGSGKNGRVTLADVEASSSAAAPQPLAIASLAVGDRMEKRVPMSRIRARIAERLVQVQQEAAILTTFNEINMDPIMNLRKTYQEQFEKTHGVRLGFMSFFTKASIEALKRFPAVNASIDGNDVVYHNYYDIGIAIGTARGLVVPIVRNAEQMSMADVEKSIRDYAAKAEGGRLSMDDLTGGTFTITNGGTYGSLLSTPIINPPQTAILGMHKIMPRPVAENNQVVIRPMMYVALSYDHRMIDGREAVLFLATIKELLEAPARMVLGV